MKKIISIIALVIILSMSFILTGCEEEKKEEVNTFTVEYCMKDAGISKSVQGTNLTYYYIGPDDISIYYVTSWKRGVVSLRKYFSDKDKYELQKTMYDVTRCDDQKLSIYVKDYIKVDDMDAYWTEIENSSTYTIVK